MLCEMAMKAMEVIPALPSLTCALDVVYKGLVSPCKPCGKIDKDQTSCAIEQWPGEQLNGTLQVRWYHRGEAQLQACFTVRDERGLQGLRDAGQRSDLRDAHRRAALFKGRTCIININRLWTLPP
jgi:hypothetical protein